MRMMKSIEVMRDEDENVNTPNSTFWPFPRHLIHEPFFCASLVMRNGAIPLDNSKPIAMAAVLQRHTAVTTFHTEGRERERERERKKERKERRKEGRKRQR